jgi:predicted site-specific integrase-resolvase
MKSKTTKSFTLDFSHFFVNQFEKMDRSKSSSNHKDIVCGAPFEPTEVLQELSRLRHAPIEIIKSKQEDAHELLCQLLNEIHEEICQILYSSSANKNGKIYFNFYLEFFFPFFKKNQYQVQIYRL